MADPVYRRVPEEDLFSDPFAILGDGLQPGEIGGVTRLDEGVYFGQHPQYGMMINYNGEWRQPTMKQLQALDAWFASKKAQAPPPAQIDEPLPLPEQPIQESAGPAYMRDARFAADIPDGADDFVMSGFEDEGDDIFGLSTAHAAEGPPEKKADTIPPVDDNFTMSGFEEPGEAGIDPEDYDEAVATAFIGSRAIGSHEYTGAPTAAVPAHTQPEVRDDLSQVAYEGLKGVIRNRAAGWGSFLQPEVTKDAGDKKLGVQAGIEMLLKPPVLVTIQDKLSGMFKKASEADVLQEDPDYKGPQTTVGEVVGIGPQIGLQVVEGIAGGALVAMTDMGMEILGSSVEESMNAGATEKDATAWGLLNAGVQAGLEGLGLSKTLKFFKTRGAIINKIRKGVEAIGTEWLTEFVQSFPDAITHIFATNPDKAVLDNIDTFLDALPETAKQGAKEGLLVLPWTILTGGAANTANSFARKQRYKKLKAVRDTQQTLRAFRDSLEDDAKMAKVAPDVTLDGISPGDTVGDSPIKFDGYQQSLKDGKIVDDDLHQFTVQEGNLKGVTFSVSRADIEADGPAKAINSKLEEMATVRDIEPDVKLAREITPSSLQDSAKEYGSEDEFVEYAFKKQSAYRRAFGQAIAKELGGKYTRKAAVPDDIKSYIGDYGSRVSVGGVDVYFGASSEHGDIYVSNIASTEPGTGLGSRFMEALKVFADKTGQGIKVYKVTNPGFFDRFDWMEKTESGDFEYKNDSDGDFVYVPGLKKMWQEVHGQGDDTRMAKEMEKKFGHAIVDPEAPVEAGMYKPAIRVNDKIHAMAEGTATTHLQIIMEAGLEEEIDAAGESNLDDGFVDVGTKKFYTRSELAEKLIAERPELLKGKGLIARDLKFGITESTALNSAGLIKWAKDVLGKGGAAASATEAHRANIETEMARISVKAKNAGRTVVHATVASIPEEDLTPKLKKEIEGGAKVYAWFNTRTGSVHMVAENIPTVEKAIAYWMHEQVGHRGIRGAFGDDALVDKFFDSIYDVLKNQDPYYMEAIVSAYDADVKTAAGRAIAAEEFFAWRASQMTPEVEKSVWAAFKKLLSAWLKKISGNETYQFTDKDVDAALGAAREYIFRGKNDGGPGTPTGDMLKWDYDKIRKAAGGRHQNVAPWLAANGWNGQDMPPSAISYVKRMSEYTDKEKKFWQGVRKVRVDMARGDLVEGTKAYDRAMKKYGAKIEGHTVRHLTRFQVGASALYGPKKSEDKPVTLTVGHPLTGEFEVTRYVTPEGMLVHDLPIFSSDPKQRAAEIDKIIQTNKDAWRWYDDWNKWMRSFQDQGLPEDLVTKYIKIQAILSGQTGPQANQLKFTQVVDWLEKNHRFEERDYKGKDDGVGIARPDAVKMNEIWHDEISLNSLAEMRARYGKKVGTYMYTALIPQHTQAIVIDRHMGRAFGYDLGWVWNRGWIDGSGNIRREGFTVKPIVEVELTREILAAADRAGISAGAAQAALWFGMRPADVEAGSYREAAQISPGYSPQTMLDATLYKSNWAKHFSPHELDYIIGSQLDAKHNSYSDKDVGARKDQATDKHPYIPYSQYYNMGVRPEVSVRTGATAYAISMKDKKIYDLTADLFGFRDLARKLHSGDPQAHLSNIIAKIIRNHDYDGFSVVANSSGDRWTQMFKPQEALPSVTTVVRMSDVVESVGDYPQDVAALADLNEKKMPELMKELSDMIKDRYHEVKVEKSYGTVARFGDEGEGATSGQMEDGVTLELSGPLPSIRSLLSEYAGLGKSQRMIFIQYDPKHYAMEKELTNKLRRAVPLMPKSLANGTRFMFPVRRDMSETDVQAAIDSFGIRDFNIARSASGTLSIDQFIGGWEAELAADFAKLYDAIGQKGRLTYHDTYSETLGDLDGDLPTAYQNYRKHIEGHFTKDRGGDIYGAAVERGEKHKLKESGTGDAEEDGEGGATPGGRDGDNILQPEDESTDTKLAKEVGEVMQLAFKISDMKVTGDTKLTTVMELADPGQVAYRVEGSKVKSRPGVKPRMTLKEVAPGQVRDLVKEAGTTAAKITQEQYERVIKQLKAAQRQALRDGKDATAAVITMRMRAVMSGWKSREKTRKEVNQILKALKKAYKRVPKLSDPIKAGITGLLDEIDFSKPTKKTLLKLNRVRDYLETNPEAEMPEGVLASLGRLDKTPARDMSIDDLRDVFMAVKNLLHIEATKNKIKYGRRVRALAALKSEALGQFRDAKDVKNELYHEPTRFQKVGDMAEWVVNAFGLHSWHFDWVIEKMAGANSVIDTVVNKGIKAGVLKQAETEEAAYSVFRNELKAKGLIDAKGRGVRLVNLNGKKVGSVLEWLGERVPTPGEAGGKMTRANRMSIFMLALSPDNRRHLLEGGYGVKMSKRPNKIYRMDEATLEEILNDITSEEEDFAMASQKVFDLLWPQESDIYYEKNGYRPQKVSGVYWPIKVHPIALGGNEEADTALEMFKGRFTRPGAPKGHMKSRVKSKKPLYIIPFDTMLAGSIRSSATYIGLEMPMTHASRLLFGPNGLELEIRDRYGDKYFQAIEQGLRDIVGEHKTYDEIEGWFRRYKNRFVTSVLGLNPWVIAKQPLSYALFNAYADVEWMALGFAQYALATANASLPGHTNRIIDMHKKYSVERRERSESGPDREIADIFKGGSKKRLWGGKKGFQEKIMSGIKGADLLAVDPGMQGVVLHALHKFDTGVLTDKMREVLNLKDADIPSSMEERMVLAYKYADHAVEHTQPMFSPMHRSAWSRGGTFAQTFTMFTSFTNMAYNLIHRVTAEAINRPSNESIRKAASVYTSLLVLNPLGIMFLDGLRDKFYGRDDDDGWLTFTGWLKNVSGYMYVIRDIVQGIVRGASGKWGSYQHPAGVPIQKTIDAGVSVSKAVAADSESEREKYAKRAAEDVAELIALGAGMPLSTPKSIYKAVNKALEKEDDFSTGGF